MTEAAGNAPPEPPPTTSVASATAATSAFIVHHATPHKPEGQRAGGQARAAHQATRSVSPTHASASAARNTGRVELADRGLQVRAFGAPARPLRAWRINAAMAAPAVGR